MNKKYGKLDSNSNLLYAPSVLIVGGKQIISPFESDYLDNGYLSIVTGIDLPYKNGFDVVESYEIVEEEQTPEGIIPKHIKRVQKYVESPPQPEPQQSLEEQIIDLQNALINQKTTL